MTILQQNKIILNMLTMCLLISGIKQNDLPGKDKTMENNELT